MLFGCLGRPLATSCYADSNVQLLLGTSVITACYADLKPGVHQHSDLWLLLATFVIAACYADLKPRVHQNNDVWLPLAAFVIAVCYAEQKPGVRHAKTSQSNMMCKNTQHFASFGNAILQHSHDSCSPLQRNPFCHALPWASRLNQNPGMGSAECVKPS